MKIYLAGCFSGWRNKIKNNVLNHRFYLPQKESRQNAIANFVSDDLNAINESDLLIYYESQIFENIGNSFEAGYAFANNTPIIVYSECKYIFPFLAGIAKRIFVDWDLFIKYIKNIENDFIRSDDIMLYGDK